MTAATVTLEPPADAVSTLTVFRRSAAAEWTKIRTVRSTLWSVLAATTMMLFLAIAFGLEVQGVTPVWVAGEIAILFAQFALLIPAMLAVTSESSTGAIRTTLQGVPRRGVLGLSRLLVTVGTVTLSAVVLALAAALASGLTLDQAEFVPADVAGSIGVIALIVGSGTVVTVGLATALRSAAGTLASMFLLLLVLPAMLPNFGVRWLATIGENLPGAASMSLLEAFGQPLIGRGHAILVLAAWVVVTLFAGAWSLFRRDAA